MTQISKLDEFRKVIAKRFKSKENVIDCLQLATETFGYISEQVIAVIGEVLHVSKSEIFGVTTFYSQFSFTPKAKYNISVCTGTACFVLGANDVINALKSKLNIEENGVTADGKFGMSQVRCLGCCGLAPVVSINDKIYGHVTVADLDRILAECK